MTKKQFEAICTLRVSDNMEDKQLAKAIALRGPENFEGGEIVPRSEVPLNFITDEGIGYIKVTRNKFLKVKIDGE